MDKSLLKAGCGSPILNLFTEPLEKGLPMESLPWWIIKWLVEAVQYDGSWLSQFEEGRILDLFISVMPTLVGLSEGRWDWDVPELVKAMGRLFLEAWPVSTQTGPSYASSWTSAGTIRAFSLYLGMVNDNPTLDISLYDPNRHAKNLSINYEAIFIRKKRGHHSHLTDICRFGTPHSKSMGLYNT